MSEAPVNETLLQSSEIIVTEEELKTCIASMTALIEQAYCNAQKVQVLVLLEGAKPFADALFKAGLDRDKFSPMYVKASSYRGTTKPQQDVHVELPPELGSGEHVLIVDDIYDTGNTLAKMLDLTEPLFENVKLAVLLEKDIEHHHAIKIDFPGLKVPNRFLIGFGLDYQNRFRSLPYITELNIPH